MKPVIVGALALGCLAAQGDDAAKITVQPSLCVLAPTQSACDLRMTVRWRSSRSASYCVWNALQKNELRCWQDATEGEVVDARKIDASLAYWLTDQLRTLRLAETEVKVLKAKSADRRRSRKRRHAWSIL